MAVTITFTGVGREVCVPQNANLAPRTKAEELHAEVSVELIAPAATDAVEHCAVTVAAHNNLPFGPHMKETKKTESNMWPNIKNDNKDQEHSQYSPELAYVAVIRWTTSSAEPVLVAGRSQLFADKWSDIKLQLVEDNAQLHIPGKLYTVLHGTHQWNIVQNEHGLSFLLITHNFYPVRVVIQCLEELQRQVAAKYQARALQVQRDGELSPEIGAVLHALCMKYDKLLEVDAISAVQKKVDAVRNVMHDNVSTALDNLVKLESIEVAAEELMQESDMFRRRAKELHHRVWWRQCKQTACISAAVLAVVGILVIVILAASRKDAFG